MHFLIEFKNRKPHIDINFRKGKYLVKTASCAEERRLAYRLHYDVFYKEFCQRDVELGIDIDRFDQISDMLIILDIDSGKLIGTYRFICSEFSKSFYSQTEFQLNEFLDQPGVKVELSRACIHPEYRKGTVIHLLWKGIYQYLSAVNANYLFGLSSITHIQAKEVLGIIQKLNGDGHVGDSLHVYPWGPFDKSKFILRELGPVVSSDLSYNLPPLFKAYLKAGAKVAAVPAYDKQFECYDFFTVLPVDELNQTHARKYSKN
ncbi:MAG: GNAT family N-acetyltransferase [Oligoflexales bacterium]|nr:GNAT family N-acetyltransferase [Oligoflexales bacterium]